MINSIKFQLSFPNKQCVVIYISSSEATLKLFMPVCCLLGLGGNDIFSAPM